MPRLALAATILLAMGPSAPRFGRSHVQAHAAESSFASSVVSATTVHDNLHDDALADDAPSERDLATTTIPKWHPMYSAGWSAGHCLFTRDANTQGYPTQLACCNGAYRGQSSGYCLSQLPSPPTSSPTGEVGDVWYPDYTTPYAEAYCLNETPIPGGPGSRPTYGSMLECCKAAYGSQMSGMCLSMLPSPPTMSPTESGGLDLWYPDYSIDDYSEGVCTNQRPLPDGRITFDSQLACCKGAYGSQMSGKCLQSLPSPPTTAPTRSGGLDVWYPDRSRSYANGVCINDGPAPPNGVVTYDSQDKCCSGVYPGQSTFACVCSMDDRPAFCDIMELERELDGARCITQADVDSGTLIITRPGSYKLCENIVFAPGEPDLAVATDEEIANAFDPVAVGGSKYDKNEYSLGFFAAIAIAADDVTLLLNGYTVEQGKSHALMQRFFGVIELASSPFIPAVGPADFVGDGTFKPARNFVLKGPGTIGLSSHHGIHGNNNENVAISDVIFRDYEVAAVSLNNVDGLTIENCEIPHNRQDVPILGAFSAARNMLPYLKALKEATTPYSTQLKGATASAVDVYNALVTAVANVYKDVMQTGFINPSTHPDEYSLFHNIHKIVDGPCYVFLVHGKGPAVGGQGFTLSDDPAAISSNVKILNNKIDLMRCWTNEVPGVVVDIGVPTDPHNAVQNDARGGVLQLISTVRNEWLANNADGHYTGNVVADAQIMVASAIHDGVLSSSDNILQIGVNTIAPSIVAWAADGSSAFSPGFDFRCNGDSMHHVNKGSIMIRVEDTQGFHINGNTISSASVLSGPAAGTAEYFDSFPGTSVAWSCNDYHKGASPEDGDAQQLANLRGISVAAVSHFLDLSDSEISGNTLVNFESEFADFIIGIDIQGESEGVAITSNYVNLKNGVGEDSNDAYIGCRVRAYVDQGEIIKSGNTLFQEEVLEAMVSRKLRGGSRIPGHHPFDVESEWEYGGCPFGRN